ncbi:glycerophosphodiester phosphodiesterase [Bacteroidota bacterium]
MKFTLKIIRVLIVITLFVLIPLCTFFYILKLPESPDASNFSAVEFVCRGGKIFGPENALSTIKTSVENGVKALEIDVQITSDDVLVLFYDDTLGRTTNGKGKIDTMTFLQLQSFNILHDDGSVSAEKISTLESVIKYAKTQDLLIDINFNMGVHRKREATKKISELFEKYDLYKTAYVSSIDHRIVYRIRKKNPDIITSLILKPKISGLHYIDNLHRSPRLARFVGVGIIKPHYNLLKKRFVRKWQRKGYIIHAKMVESKDVRDDLISRDISVTTRCPNCSCEK